MKRYIEMRGADCGSVEHMAALPAFWVGLLYDQSALDAAWDLVRGWDEETREALRVAASVSALQGRVGGINLQDLSKEVLAISTAGLATRARESGVDEVGFLDVLHAHVKTGRVQADNLMAQYEGAWGQDLDNIYNACKL